MSDISEIATNIHRLNTVLGRVADRTLQDSYGYGMSQFKIVWMLYKHSEGVLQTDIAGWLNQTEAAVSRQIRLLHDQDLVAVEVDPDNRRNHIIVLSKSGRLFAQNAMKILLREYEPFFADLSESELQNLNQLLEKIFTKVIITCKEI